MMAGGSQMKQNFQGHGKKFGLFSDREGFMPKNDCNLDMVIAVEMLRISCILEDTTL